MLGSSLFHLLGEPGKPVGDPAHPPPESLFSKRVEAPGALSPARNRTKPATRKTGSSRIASGYPGIATVMRRDLAAHGSWRSVLFGALQGRGQSPESHLSASQSMPYSSVAEGLAAAQRRTRRF
jgi:hypothetical protein